MGQHPPFPQGPFIPASILRCPVVLIFALSQQGTLTLHCEPFADPLLLPRGATYRRSLRAAAGTLRLTVTARLV